ncbi:MAG: hypothetical protein IKJ65_06380 [Clostridia bacterium]|nr:hypothetical protein [Clostridia bacterium]
MARVRGEVHFAWRLVLLPLFLGYLKLFDAFDFVFQMASVRFIDYVWNFVLLGVCFLGLVLLIAANPRRRLLAGLGMALVLAPLYLESLQDGTLNFRTAASGVQITNIPLNMISMGVFFSASVWGLLMMRGPKKREWEKAVLFLFLIGRLAGLFVWPDAGKYGYFWFSDARLFAISILVGAAADAVYRGLCAADVVTAFLCGGWLVAAEILKEVNIEIILYAAMALSIVYATVLLCSKPAKNMYLGFILSLLGMVAMGSMYIMNIMM